MKLFVSVDVDLTTRFLWTYDNSLRVFKWTGKNDYITLCEPENISFGEGR